MKNATMCYLHHEGKILFLYRHKGQDDIHNGFYVPPGGQIEVEKGETGLACIVREFEEETNLRISNPRLRAVVTFDNRGRILGGKLSPEDWKVEVYEAHQFEGELKGEEGKNAEPIWVDDSQVSSLNMHEGDRKIWDLITQHKEGLFEVLVQYDKEKLITFDVKRIDKH